MSTVCDEDFDLDFREICERLNQLNFVSHFLVCFWLSLCSDVRRVEQIESFFRFCSQVALPMCGSVYIICLLF